MSFFEWDENMSVGVPLVDDDHRLLVSLVNQLHDSVGDREEREVLGSVLDTLLDYTVFHFQREEKVMEAAGYPGLEAHRHQHNDLTDKVRALQKSYAAGSPDVVGVAVLDFVKTWLVEHILGHDRAFAPMVRDNLASQRAAEEVPRIRGAKPAKAGFDWTKVKVLLIDDNVNFRRVTRTILQTVHVAEVQEAANGAEALELMMDFLPDVILCDWQMDEMDGMEFVRRLRTSRTAKVPPVIMLTGFGDDASREEAAKLGLAEFIEKPVTARGLLMAVARVVGGG